MKSNPVSRHTALVVFFVGLAIGYTFAFLDLRDSRVWTLIAPGAPIRPGSISFLQNALIEPRATGIGLPVRLTIPKINVDATVEQVGLTPNGAMGTPDRPEDVAWFKPGAIPGQIGSAVITGHYGFLHGKPSTFDDLHKLRRGDVVTVQDDIGITTTFVVREIRRYAAAQDASDVFGSTDSSSHLNLVTCEGMWDSRAQQYPTRLVVFADKQP